MGAERAGGRIPRRTDGRLGYANVMATLALFVALGGTGYAVSQLPKNSVKAKQIAKNAVGTSELKDNKVKGRDVDEISLAQVPSAESASNADLLDGVDSTGFLRNTPPEAFREIGAPGQPTFQGTWANEAPAIETTAAFFKDPFDIVHLKGILVGGGNGELIFTLPTGHRPTKNVVLASIRNGAIAQVSVGSNGEVRQGVGGSAGGLALDGLTFRAGAG